jgi:hypothetical protein
MDARRNEIVASAFRSALGQHRRFDVDETGIVEEAAEGARRPVAQLHVLLHLRPTQVDHPVQQAGVLRQMLVVELKGRRQ